ncbi:MAG: glycosyltransferase involved in cell wall biosynthesis [Halioglobus sp.]|jgi:glycosyltransferase involved in cell wall biosynthesis
MKSDTLHLSVVLPVYYSGKIFPELYQRLTQTLESITSSFEIIAVVDGCTDDTAAIVASFHEKDPRVKLIELSRNFGNQMAITAGLRHSLGEMVIVMDDDLEDPPELIPELLNKANEGFDVVYAVRRSRKISAFRHTIFKGYYKLLSKMVSHQVIQDVGDFCLMRRPVVEVLNNMPEGHRYIRGLRSWAGFSQAGVDFDRQERSSGESGFGLSQYLKFAFDGIFSFSQVPLILSTYLGFAISLFSFLAGGWFLFAKLTGIAPNVPGYASIVISVLFIGGVQLLSIGVLSQYVGRIYDEVRGRPPYIVKRSMGIRFKDVAPREDPNII